MERIPLLIRHCTCCLPSHRAVLAPFRMLYEWPIKFPYAILFLRTTTHEHTNIYISTHTHVTHTPSGMFPCSLGVLFWIWSFPSRLPYGIDLTDRPFLVVVFVEPYSNLAKQTSNVVANYLLYSPQRKLFAAFFNLRSYQLLVPFISEVLVL